MDWSACVEKLDPSKADSQVVATINCVFVLYEQVLNAAFYFAGGVALIFIIVAGYKFIRSSGDPKQVEGARKTMTFAIIGLLLILFSFAIINFIAAVTGSECVKVFGFNSCVNDASVGCFYKGEWAPKYQCHQIQAGNDPATPIQSFYGTDAGTKCDTYCSVLNE